MIRTFRTLELESSSVSHRSGDLPGASNKIRVTESIGVLIVDINLLMNENFMFITLYEIQLEILFRMMILLQIGSDLCMTDG